MGATRKPRQSKKGTAAGKGTLSVGGSTGNGIGGFGLPGASGGSGFGGGVTGTSNVGPGNVLSYHESKLVDFSVVQTLEQELSDIHKKKASGYSKEVHDYLLIKLTTVQALANLAEEKRIKKEHTAKNYNKLKEADKKAIGEAFEALNIKEQNLLQSCNESILELVVKLTENGEGSWATEGITPPVMSGAISDLFKKIESDHTDYILDTFAVINELADLESAPPPTDDKEVEIMHKRKKELTQVYLSKINLVTSIDPSKIDESFVRCVDCNATFVDQEDGNLVCTQCGKTLTGYICVSSNFSYKELQNYISKPQFTYKKETHFLEHIRRLVAQENKVIDPSILQQIVAEARKHHITNLNNLNEDLIKKFLKKLGLKDYYDNVISIKNLLSGRKPFILTKEIEEKLKIMFSQIQAPYYKHKPDNRKNFFSYPYIMYQFFTILDLHEFTRYFHLLKSIDKLRTQDEIFKKIVADLAPIDKTIRWRFTPCT